MNKFLTLGIMQPLGLQPKTPKGVELSEANRSPEGELASTKCSAHRNEVKSELADKNSLLVHKDMLLEAALDGSALYSATAQVLYEIAADTVFAEYTPLPVTVMQPRKAEVNDAITQEQFLPFINVYPNPADAEINIEYDFTALYDEGNDLLLEQLGIDRREDCVKGELCIFTEDGKLLLQFRLNAVTDSFSISIEDYTPGIYMLVIKDCYGNSKTVKITKNK